MNYTFESMRVEHSFDLQSEQMEKANAYIERDGNLCISLNSPKVQCVTEFVLFVYHQQYCVKLEGQKTKQRGDPFYYASLVSVCRVCVHSLVKHEIVVEAGRMRNILLSIYSESPVTLDLFSTSEEKVFPRVHRQGVHL